MLVINDHGNLGAPGLFQRACLALPACSLMSLPICQRNVGPGGDCIFLHVESDFTGEDEEVAEVDSDP